MENGAPPRYLAPVRSVCVTRRFLPSAPTLPSASDNLITGWLAVYSAASLPTMARSAAVSGLPALTIDWMSCVASAALSAPLSTLSSLPPPPAKCTPPPSANSSGKLMASAQSFPSGTTSGSLVPRCSIRAFRYSSGSRRGKSSRSAALGIMRHRVDG